MPIQKTVPVSWPPILGNSLTPGAAERQLQLHFAARHRLDVLGEHAEGKALDHVLYLLVFALPRHALRLAAAVHCCGQRRHPASVAKTCLMSRHLRSLSPRPAFQDLYPHAREHRAFHPSIFNPMKSMAAAFPCFTAAETDGPMLRQHKSCSDGGPGELPPMESAVAMTVPVTSRRISTQLHPKCRNREYEKGRWGVCG